ncbi:hypothetical protein [Flagellimonas pacifica]|uniref:Uncharacterized protein n=1 Tax=Flagellimonas pacifica TaxID=1247520 RepID=A0A285MX02_9FLAO|nr:hypothetical protein [Allomuricauda parva]SNZ01730.1 hypothetical protein SAMN06265377_3572 [Allomuricauda parva]
MNIKLTKEQSQMGDDFLRKLLSDGTLERNTVYEFFNDRDLAIVVCKTLEQKGIISLSGPTYNDPFVIAVPEDGISTFLKNGGLSKIAADREKQDTTKAKDEEIRDLTAKNLRLQNRQMKRAVLYSIIGFIVGVIATNLKDILIFFNVIKFPD